MKRDEFLRELTQLKVTNPPIYIEINCAPRHPGQGDSYDMRLESITVFFGVSEEPRAKWKRIRMTPDNMPAFLKGKAVSEMFEIEKLMTTILLSKEEQALFSEWKTRSEQ